jgi:hypothetical protein
MSYLKYGKKKSQYTSVLVSLFAMPTIAILTFLGVVPLEQYIGWIAVVGFIVSLILYFTKFKNAKLGMKKGDEDNIG